MDLTCNKGQWQTLYRLRLNRHPDSGKIYLCHRGLHDGIDDCLTRLMVRSSRGWCPLTSCERWRIRLDHETKISFVPWIISALSSQYCRYRLIHCVGSTTPWRCRFFQAFLPNDKCGRKYIDVSLVRRIRGLGDVNSAFPVGCGRRQGSSSIAPYISRTRADPYN